MHVPDLKDRVGLVTGGFGVLAAAIVSDEGRARFGTIFDILANVSPAGA